MGRKEVTVKEDIMTVTDISKSAEITYWTDGGWGADILAGKQIRDHRGIDANSDSRYTEKLLHILFEYGYETDTDWKPARMELYGEKYGYLDIHPLVLHEDGIAKQALLEGD